MRMEGETLPLGLAHDLGHHWIEGFFFSLYLPIKLDGGVVILQFYSSLSLDIRSYSWNYRKVNHFKGFRWTTNLSKSLKPLF